MEWLLLLEFGWDLGGGLDQAKFMFRGRRVGRFLWRPEWARGDSPMVQEPSSKRERERGSKRQREREREREMAVVHVERIPELPCHEAVLYSHDHSGDDIC